MMKKVIIVLFGLIMIEPAFAWNICFNMECSDCSDSYTPQQLRMEFNGANSSFVGIVQANDDSFGRIAVGGIRSDGHVVFVRPRNKATYVYAYDIDLNTFNGVDTITGTRTELNYGYTEGVNFSIGNTNQTSLFLTQCPE